MDGWMDGRDKEEGAPSQLKPFSSWTVIESEL